MKFRLNPVRSLASLFFVLAILSGCERQKKFHLQTETVKVDSLEQIQLVTNPVKPFLYTNISGLEKLPVREAKAKFISAIIPAILVAKYKIHREKELAEELRAKKEWEQADSALFVDMKNRYKAKDMDDLLTRMVTLPTSLVLAQAAIESGWGKSRIFLRANNLFGVWSYNLNEPRIAALSHRNNKRTYLRWYTDPSQSVVHYFEILARSRSYKSLREASLQTNDPFELLPHLKNYSESRTIYTNQLKKLILRNNLTQFDHYQIDPSYIVEE